MRDFFKIIFQRRHYQSFLQGFLVLIFMETQILILMTYPHIFLPLPRHFHWPSALTNRFKRNINEELNQAMSTSSDIKTGKDCIFKKYLNYLRTFIYSVISPVHIKVGKDRIFKKCLNAGFLRTFIYSLLSAFDTISTPQD